MIQVEVSVSDLMNQRQGRSRKEMKVVMGRSRKEMKVVMGIEEKEGKSDKGQFCYPRHLFL